MLKPMTDAHIWRYGWKLTCEHSASLLTVKVVGVVEDYGDTGERKVKYPPSKCYPKREPEDDRFRDK